MPEHYQQNQPAPQSEEELPIDIDYAKFLDWLVDRQRIPRHWHTLLKSARTLTRTALSQTPPTIRESLNIPSLDPHQNLPYYTVRKVVQSLTDPTAPPEWGSLEKDILGRYKSPLHRAWSDALSAFEKKYVFLADTAQELVRNAEIEAPAIKASVAKLNNDLADLVRREGPSIRAAQEARQRFTDACNEFSLKQDHQDFETQIIEYVDRRVPNVLAAVVNTAKTHEFGDVLQYYDQFANFVLDTSNKDLCKTVKDVRDGDVDQLTRKLVLQEDATAIDWGETVDMSMPAPLNEQPDVGEIDWGIEINASGTAVEAAVDSLTETAADASGESKELDKSAQKETGINWDVDQDLSAGGINWSEDVTASEATTVANDATGTEPETLTLADPTTRERFLTDLLELDAFLSQRVTELSRSAESEIGLVLQQATSWPDSIKRVDIERVRKMHGLIKLAIDGINSDETRRLLGLQSNRKRLERSARSVLEKKLLAERAEQAVVLLKQRRVRTGQELATEIPRLQELGNATREVKRWTEKVISGLYNGRCVNILGEINNVFPPVD